jgi:O-acetyl-ADP-ribose deacetylase (regulator of RNase III)
MPFKIVRNDITKMKVDVIVNSANPHVAVGRGVDAHIYSAAGWDKLFEHMHPMNIAWDRIHPNQTGCMYIAKQFLAAVGFDR